MRGDAYDRAYQPWLKTYTAQCERRRNARRDVEDATRAAAAARLAVLDAKIYLRSCDDAVAEHVKQKPVRT